MEWDGGVVGGKVKRSVLFFLFRLHGSGVLDISSYLSLTLTYTSLPFLLFFLCNKLIVFLCFFLYLFLIARGVSRLGGMWGAIITLLYQRIFRFRGQCIVGGVAKHRTVQSSISLTCTEILETPFLSYG